MTKTAVREYYDYTLPFYSAFWHGASRGVHYGYWKENTRSLQQAILNMNEILSDKASITQNDLVLDAGCGIGGSGLWLAKHTGSHVTGITISEKQKEKAEVLAARYGFQNKLSFAVGDYFATSFPDASFSVVWGLESMCYAHPRVNELAKEMYRVLKPGGRIVVADGFRGRTTGFSEREVKLMQEFNEGFVLDGLITLQEFAEALTGAGFKNVATEDITEHILPTARIMYRRCLLTYPLLKLTERFRIFSPMLTKNNRTGIVQRELFEKRTMRYGICYGEK